MRRPAIGGLAVALLVALSVAAAPPDEAPAKKSAAPPSTGWSFRRLIGLNEKPTPEKKAPEKKTAKTDEPAPAPLVPKAKSGAAERQREEQTWQRREAVILKLQEIALETNDVELERLTEQLRERVWAVYMERVAGLPAGRAALENEERILNRHLDVETITTRPALSGAGADRNRRAAVGEGNR